MTFSVLICTYNRPDMLAMALRALIEGTVEKPDQVVVVNGGDERSDRIVIAYQDQPGIRVELIKTINRNLAASRNVGLPHCDGDIVAMTDDDAEVFPDWVTQMKRIHAEHPEAGGVGGAVIGAHSANSLLSRIADVVTFASPPQPGYVRTIAGVNVSYKRAAVQQVGPQDETLFRGEDVDYNWRVKKLGYEIYYDPAIQVRHYHRPTFRQFVNQFYMYGRAYYLVRRKWPEMYCVYPHKITRFRDVLKLLYFLLSTLFEPFKISRKMPGFYDRMISLPIIYTLHIAWKYGMLVQKS
ncbi:MAG: glycosyltransferase family 2 protein [Anaerolineae bacterium]